MDVLDDFVDGLEHADEIRNEIGDVFVSIRERTNPFMEGTVVLDGSTGERKMSVTPRCMTNKGEANGRLADNKHLRMWKREMDSLRNRDDALAVIVVLTAKVTSPDGDELDAVTMHVESLATDRQALFVWEILGTGNLSGCKVYPGASMNIDCVHLGTGR